MLGELGVLNTNALIYTGAAILVLVVLWLMNHYRPKTGTAHFTKENFLPLLDKPIDISKGKIRLIDFRNRFFGTISYLRITSLDDDRFTTKAYKLLLDDDIEETIPNSAKVHPFTSIRSIPT